MVDDCQWSLTIHGIDYVCVLPDGNKNAHRAYITGISGIGAVGVDVRVKLEWRKD